MAIKDNEIRKEELEPLSSDKKRDINNNDYEASSWQLTGIVMANIILGLGLLSYPQAFSNAGGVMCAFVLQLLCMIPIGAGFAALAKASLLHPEDFTYQDVVGRYCGRIAMLMCHVIIFLHNFGTCITFLVLLADQIDEVMLFAFDKEFCYYWFLNRHFTMPCVACLFILPCCFMKNLTGIALKAISILGVLTTGYIIFLVIYKYYTTDDIKAKGDGKKEYEWTDVIDAIPVICFSFEAHVEAPPLFACMKKRSSLEISKAVTLGLGISAFVYTIVGVFGYLTIGPGVPSDVLLSYYPPDVVVIIGTALMAVKSITTYPAIMFCVRITVDDVLLPYGEKLGFSEKRQIKTHTCLLFAASVIIAIAVPTIGHVIMLLGGSAALLILVFPGCCMMQLHMYSKAQYKLVAGVCMIVLGVFLACTMTLTSVFKYMYGREAKLLICQ